MAGPLGNFKSPAAGLSAAMQDVQQQREAQTEKLASGITPMPDIPKAQGQGLSKDYLKSHIGLFAAMTLLSVLGAKRTSAPMTAAMNNMTASMKGFMSGNQMERQSANQQMWENFDAAMQQHRASLERYKVELEKMYKDPKAQQQQLYMSLLEQGYDPKMAAEMSNPATAARIYETNVKAMTHANEAADKVRQHQQQHQDQQKAKFESERASLGAKKAAATTPEAKKSYQDEIDAVNMRERITLGTQPSGGGYNKEQQDWIDRAMSQNPGMTREQVIDEGKKLGRL